MFLGVIARALSAAAVASSISPVPAGASSLAGTVAPWAALIIKSGPTIGTMTVTNDENRSLALDAAAQPQDVYGIGSVTAASSVTYTVPIFRPALAWTSAASFSLPEGEQLSQPLTATNATSYSVVGGPDAAKFTISGSTLSLLAKDYELPTDVDGDNVYQVAVRAAGPGGTADQAIAVTVTDVVPTATDNKIANAKFTGGVAGSPGTMPTGYAVSGFAGLTQTLVFGTLPDGRSYMDVCFKGTPSDTSGLIFMPAAAFPASTADKVSIEAALTAGSWNGIRAVSGLADEYTSSSAYVATDSLFTFLTPAVLGAARMRFDHSFTTSSTTASANPYFRFDVTNGAAVDFTMRLVQPYIGVAGASLDPVAEAEPSPVVAGSLIWSDEFNGNSVSLSDGTTSRDWRPNDFYQQINRGYADFAANTYNVAPLEPGFAAYNPFSVANGMLTIAASRIPAGLTSTVRTSMDAGGQSAVATPSWMSGILITDQATRKFKYGYIEWRMRLPTPGKGMASALWLFGTDGNSNADGKGQAEIDVLETLSGLASGRPWSITLHEGTNSGAGTQVNVGSFNDDTTMWHNYGLDWQPTYLKFYKDNALVASITGADAAYFNTTMGIRIGNPVDFRFVSDPNGLSDSSTPNPMLMNVDYIRVYSAKPY